jgi:hypothetical protein
MQNFIYLLHSNTKLKLGRAVDLLNIEYFYRINFSAAIEINFVKYIYEKCLQKCVQQE